MGAATRMTKLLACSMTGLASWLIAGAASSELNVATSIRCPAAAESGSTPTIDVLLENRGDFTVPVRILSGFTANVNGSAAGLALHGPVVAANEQVAGSSIRDVSIAALPAIPPALGNRMATYVIVSEWDGGVQRESDECLVLVPEPARALHGLAAASGMLISFHLRRASSRRRSEVES